MRKMTRPSKRQEFSEAMVIFYSKATIQSLIAFTARLLSNGS